MTYQTDRLEDEMIGDVKHHVIRITPRLPDQIADCLREPIRGDTENRIVLNENHEWTDYKPIAYGFSQSSFIERLKECVEWYNGVEW